MIIVPCETELLEEVDQWLSSHCQGMRLNGDSIELVANTSSSELELVLESQSHSPAATAGAQHDAKESQEVQGLWLNKVKDRIQAEASLCREFSAKRLSENAKRVYAARAAALEFAFKLLTETSNPMDYVNNPVPDHYVHPTERGTRSRRIETQHCTELSDDTQGCSAEHKTETVVN
jgi:hypothetical protein